jgi:hypothetical protein
MRPPLFEQAIGRSRGGRTTKIHALIDAIGRPRVLMIAPGNLHDGDDGRRTPPRRWTDREAARRHGL